MKMASRIEALESKVSGQAIRRSHLISANGQRPDEARAAFVMAHPEAAGDLIIVLVRMSAT